MPDTELDIDPEFFDDDDVEEDWTGPLRGKFVEVDGYGGVAFFVDGDNGEEVKAHMVGDDRPFVFDIEDVTVIDRDAFCGSCGQIGCTHDGLDRS